MDHSNLTEPTRREPTIIPAGPTKERQAHEDYLKKIGLLAPKERTGTDGTQS